jgi:hypothetical protein
MPARARVFGEGARILQPVRAVQDRGKRQAVDRRGVGVPAEGSRVDRLAGAIGAPVGGQKDIHRRRGFAAFDTPVGQIELGVSQRQESQIGIGIPKDDKRGGLGACPAGKARVEAGVSLIVGRRRGKHGIGAAEKFDGDPRFRCGCREAADKDMQTVDATHRRQAEVRDHKPLPCGGHDIGVGSGG